MTTAIRAKMAEIMRPNRWKVKFCHSGSSTTRGALAFGLSKFSPSVPWCRLTLLFLKRCIADWPPHPDAPTASLDLTSDRSGDIVHFKMPDVLSSVIHSALCKLENT